MLSARFDSNFFLEGVRFVSLSRARPAPVVGYCRGPALAAISFWRGPVLTASAEARSGSLILPRAPLGNSFVLERPVLTASVGPAPAGRCSGSQFQQFFVVLKAFEGANPAVGCYRGPDLAAFLF